MYLIIIVHCKEMDVRNTVSYQFNWWVLIGFPFASSNLFSNYKKQLVVEQPVAILTQTHCASLRVRE